MVLSNYKCMHIRIQNSEISIQGLQTYSSNVSSNRIKIHVILLILNRLLLLVIHFRNAPFEAVVLQSSQRLPELLFYMKKSYRVLQAPIPAPIPAPLLHVHITLQSREFSIQNPILHAEDKEHFEYYYYIQRAKRPSFQKRNSMHRRQGDLLEIHPCVLQDLPMTFQAFQPQDLPKAFQLLELLQLLRRHSRHSSHS